MQLHVILYIETLASIVVAETFLILETSSFQENQICTVTGQGEYHRLGKIQTGAVVRLTATLIP